MASAAPVAPSPDPAGGLAALAARHGLPRLGGRPGLGEYLRRLWERRHFTVELARARFSAERSHDRLGLAWVVLLPLINAAVYFFVFGVLIELSNRPPNYVAFLIIGVFLFQYFTSSMTTGSKSITGNLGLVRALHFPRALLPIATQLQQAFKLGPIVAVMVVLVLVTGERPTVEWLLLIPAVLLLMLFAMGVGFLMARATVHVRDVARLQPFINRLLFYTSGILFDVNRIDLANKVPAWLASPVEWTLQLNPVHVFINLARGALLESQTSPGWMWIAALAWAFTFLIGGFLFFWRAEERYGRA